MLEIVKVFRFNRKADVSFGLMASWLTREQ